MDLLLLRLEAPLMSFGAPIVDERGVIQAYPALSMVTGLLGNALGLEHADAARLGRLQERLRYACRCDRRGLLIRDFQTVDFSKPHMSDECAWTSWGQTAPRKGGAASSGTHIRLRDYWADAAYTVALSLEPAEEAPTLDQVEQALRRPARPLFIGRKPCLPSGPLLRGRRRAGSLLEALAETPPGPGADPGPVYGAWWSVDAETPPAGFAHEAMRRPVTDRRDWTNQIHVGQRWIAAGEVGAAQPEETRDV